MPTTAASHAAAARVVGVGSPSWPAAASVCVRGVLTGPMGPAEVLGVGPYAAYLRVPATGGVLAVVAADGIRLPNSVVLAEPAAGRPLGGLLTDRAAAVGLGRIQIGDWAAHAARWWAPRTARRPAHRFAVRSGLAAVRAALPSDEPPGGVAAEVTGLAAAVVQRNLAAALASARRLVGSGPGLTPAGDDALCGLLLALRALGPTRDPWTAEFGRRVSAYARGRTTDLSATLIGYAAGGSAIDEVVDALEAVAGWRPARPAVDRLVAVGHTSGHCLAAGIVAGAGAALRWSDPAMSRSAPAMSRSAPAMSRSGNDDAEDAP